MLTVAGGTGAPRDGAIVEEAKSPVRPETLPEESWVQRVRPHKLADQDVETERDMDSPGGRGKPVVDKCGVTAPERIPSQTGLLHLFLIVNFDE
ncbi:hypothetical protein SLEP1_g43539 [Rubroshorea leprosula]|uniref:Uncharacterized protein n=1 Tax=Rubroshorea leprosula TaxID=152421 RepID=A0AAV5LDS9_9ROSI|nr:hypothetical protein SLEP1_g43539 [Rubroshorea leprosula]